MAQQNQYLIHFHKLLLLLKINDIHIKNRTSTNKSYKEILKQDFGA